FLAKSIPITLISMMETSRTICQLQAWHNTASLGAEASITSLHAAEVVILMGGNHTHRADWFCLYPFMDFIEEAYVGKGDTHIGDGAWLGMRCMLMPGVTIGEGAVVAANSVVTQNIEPYSIVAGSPAKLIKYRFDKDVITELLALKIYDWPAEKFESLKRYLCSADFDALSKAITLYDQSVHQSK
ncbi:CatB-related O-acetyltransferase, partial [Shewanella baltica]|uniref:CatB-related O-acetyltransferase n=1 Tax=Shewanella baltica TaxID=62322 RepID=UPI003D7A4757